MATRSSRQRAQEIHKFIIESVPEYPTDLNRQISENFGISRQAAHRHIQHLVKEGILIARGHTKNRAYELAVVRENSFTVSLDKKVDEDIVWREQVRPYFGFVQPNVLTICQYGFTEILNNAIDHSEGSMVEIYVGVEPPDIQIRIADNGIGIFHKIRAELGLADVREAILELAKGKFTTDPMHHTGEGIFFTLRAFDYFRISSGRLLFTHDEPGDDWLLEEDKDVRGTTVTMGIHPDSDRILKQVFDRYTAFDEDYGFSRTRVPVKLATFGDENLISRSQAKRLVTRFERFRQVILDFKDVESIGQAFADEIFRVFANEHSQVNLTFVNANDQVEKMIRRAKANNV